MIAAIAKAAKYRSFLQHSFSDHGREESRSRRVVKTLDRISSTSGWGPVFYSTVEDEFVSPYSRSKR